jgi:hypothetical protein
MKLSARISLLFFIGIFAAGSTALGVYYYFVYHPPLEAAERFMRAMEEADVEALRAAIVIGVDMETGELREPTDDEVQVLLADSFQRGRILDQRKREGNLRDYYYLVYREPDGQVYALLVTSFEENFRVVIPGRRMSSRNRYLWEYTWTN